MVKIISLIFIIYGAFINSSYSQFNHRLELNAGAGLSSVNDIINFNYQGFEIGKVENLSGIGGNFSIAYRVEKAPLLLGLNISSYKYLQTKFNRNILTVENVYSQLNVQSIDFSAEWLLRPTKSINPYLGAGIILSHLNADRGFESYQATPPPNDPEYIWVEDIKIEFDNLRSQFSKVGAFFIVGIRWRLNDRFGINTSGRFAYYPDKEDLKISNPRFTTIYSIGVYVKIFKQRKYLL